MTFLTKKNFWHKIWVILHHPIKFEQNWVKSSIAVGVYFWTFFENLDFPNSLLAPLCNVWESFANIFWCNFSEVSAVTAKMAEVPSSNSVVHPTRPPSTASASAPSFPPASVATSAWVGGSRIGSNTPSRRSYEQIIADSSSNILIRITIQKIIDSEKPDDKPRSLSI